MSLKTLRLNVGKWDLSLDGNGNLQVATNDYATAQDVANAIRLFTNECYFDTTRGIPHFTLDLSVAPNLASVRHRYRQAALNVTHVKQAQCEVFDVNDGHERRMTGEVTIVTDSGAKAVLEL